MKFQKINNITGWFVFAIALVTYWLTMEQTASYWDCGEFIAVSYKLEVPHPPGAPLFLLIGRLFSFLALGDVTQVAYWINFASVLASACTILFLFWSIVLFGRKLLLINKREEITDNHTWILMGAGLVGSLAYTFSDTFWFSAVEAEVYAMSSFFTAWVVWAMLKWDVIEDESRANRWLILIFYMMGLSIGVHLLNLVTIPALALIYYFKKYSPTLMGILVTLVTGLLLIFLINQIIIPGLPTFAGNMEIFFVNSLRLPFNSGIILFVLLLAGAIVYGIYYTQKNGYALANTFILSFAFILIGYSSYTLVVIRSNYNPPINQNDPSDPISFVSYLKREQYGSRPLFSGPYYDAQPVDMVEGDPVYKKGTDRYIEVDRRMSYKYDPARTTILPRIWISENKSEYEEILGLRENEKPTFSDNLRFLFNHQISWMYMRYFMWNFAGRESDIQGADWLGPQQWFTELPEVLKNNKGRNNLFMIPFILGLIGMFYQFVYDQKNMAVVALLFLLLGIAIVVYLNGPPSEPRERDYIYAGSYYAFCFWIGLAVVGLAKTFSGILKNTKLSAVIATVLGLTAPGIMLANNYDDHNRNHRYFSVDSAYNYLQSCAPNAVLFTGGDNDTFPLWYNQEVEGVRTDMRVIVLSYYNTDWYVGQSMRQTYESTPLKYTLTLDNYRQGGPNDYLPFQDLKIKSIDLKEYLDLIRKDYRGLRYYKTANIIPTRELTLQVDVEHVKKLNIIPEGFDSLLVPEMKLKLTGGGLEKKDLAMLDLLATSNWERPLYVNQTSLDQFNIDLKPYVIQEGNAYRILPIQNPNPRVTLVNTKVSLDNMLTKFRYRGLDDPRGYYNQDYRNFVLNHRASFTTLVDALMAEGKTEEAKKAVKALFEKMPDSTVPYDHYNARMVATLFELGERDKALEVINLMAPRASELLVYLANRRDLNREFQISYMTLDELQRVLYQNGEKELAKPIEETLNRVNEMLNFGNPDSSEF
ncbi:MAG: DUF2723 domain-containing protein [Cyclobacteriaceae bacterium]|nr:DUF2723 domain-containing protein [Cytophagales bacterium]MCZ8329120.1 DUF2723 domain-containing protein [Cyclobacteriaceae bacterium]